MELIFKQALKIDEDVIKIKVKKYQIRNSDVFLLGYPKSGTTWAQELIWLILNDLNYDGAKAFVDERVPVLEMCAYWKGDAQSNAIPECHKNSMEFAYKLKDPRCIKTHSRWEYLPDELLNDTKNSKMMALVITGITYYTFGTAETNPIFSL
ncbi:hypothetical protein RN001_005130 [Aquatica leii]|uniref:Sulfotransferase domain-containing protein n=1 Tax=Aquatica leii TaxID=1421715 RepID=A0AAN7PJE2_9COLE|nr:hypothetical protein RN001_005130 [Aquatica leii]